jgi:hypothetical protein
MNKILTLILIGLTSNFFAQQVLWQNDFSNPTEWAISNNTNDQQDWVISTSTATTLGYGTGAWVDGSNTVSNENGYALFDSDALGSNGGSQDALMTYTGSIDCSAYPNLILEFNQRIRLWQTTETIFEISNDGGTTWIPFSVNLDKTTSSTYEEKGQLDITSAAGGQANVKIRLRYIGTWDYAWLVDDLNIIEQPSNDIRSISPFYVGTNNGGIEYGRTPVNHLDDSYDVGGKIFNFGSSAATNVQAFVDFGTSSFIYTVGTSGIVPSGDTLLYGNTETTNTPVAVGLYNGIYTVASNEELLTDPTYSNNIAKRNFEITTNVYSIDGIGVHPPELQATSSLGSNSFNFTNGTYFANMYHLRGGINKISSFEILLGNGTTSGTEIQIAIIDTAELYADGSTPLIDLNGNEALSYYQITTNDVSNGKAVIYFNQPVSLSDGAYYAAVLTYVSNTDIIRILDDQTIPQPVYASVIHSLGDGTFTNGNAFGIRMNLCNGAPPTNETLNVSACSPYISPTNQSYIQSGTYNEAIPNMFGCDSVNLTINLTILNSGSSVSATICNGDTYEWNSQQYYQAGQYSQTFINQIGCDSVVTLNLNVNYNDNIFISPNPTFGNAPLTVAFANQTSNLSNYNFTWYFGDGSSQQSNAPFLSHIYTQDGYANVTVVAENLTTGCTSSHTFDNLIFVIGGVTCTHSATLNQTSPITGCVGDSLLLSCNTDASFSYQWNRNGIPVNGATTSSFYPTQSGSYTVTIYQNNCPVTSAGISVTINSLPPVPTITQNGVFVPCTGGTISLLAPNGFASYLWNTGSTESSLIVSQSGNFSVSVTDNNGCSRTSNPFVVNASFMAPPQVCIVGIDSLTNENRVVWEKPLTQGIDSFYVYKESNISDVYTKIGATNYDDLAVFLDVNSNPAVQAYRYKISALDTCGVETNVSEFHKTIHLTINQGVGNSWNLIWSHYEGLNFGSYNIYRGTDLSNMSLLTTIQSNLNSYSDLTPPTGATYYQIEVVNPVNCDPTKSINYGVSRSNIVNNGVSGINEEVLSTLNIYPNPTNSNITLEVSSDLVGKRYSIVDFSGRILLDGKISSNQEHIDLQNVARGSYYLSIENGSSVTKLIKQ